MGSPLIIAELPRTKGERVRVALGADREVVDIRITTPLAGHVDGWVPTNKGLSLRPCQLPGLIEALQAAEVKARELGQVGAAR